MVSSTTLLEMAESRTKQLELRIARYERIMNECPHCKAALTIEEEDDATSAAMPSPSDGSLLQTAPENSSTASKLSTKKTTSTTRRGPSTGSSKQTLSTSQPIPSPSDLDVLNPASSKPVSSSRSREIASGARSGSARSSARTSKKTGAEAAPSSTNSSSTPQNLTANSLSLRPTSLKPLTSVIDNKLQDVNGQQENELNLSRSGSNMGRTRNNPHKQADWVASSDKMLGEVPLGWVWNEKLSKLDRSLLAAVAIDTSAVPDEVIDTLDERKNKDNLLRLVRGFAHRDSDKRVNFQIFLLVCLCNVLSAQNIPRASIVEALQIRVSDTSEKNIGKYLRGAQWVNKIMDRLFFTGWRYRAIDLIIICTYGGKGLQFLR